MNRPDFNELRSINIHPDLLSRGTGQSVALQETVVYDFMPPILGNRFRVDETLRRGIHFFGNLGSFMMAEEAHQELASHELSTGNLVSALEAYKRSLHNATEFAGAMSALGERALLSPTEIARFNLQRRFGALESGLVSALVADGKDDKVDLLKYTEWVDGVRTLESDASKLNQEYFSGLPKYPDNDFPAGDPRIWERDTSLVGDLATGTRLRDTLAKMQRYHDAAWVSKEIGDEEATAKYTELAESDPTELPGYEDIYRKIYWREEKFRYPGRFS